MESSNKESLIPSRIEKMLLEPAGLLQDRLHSMPVLFTPCMINSGPQNGVLHSRGSICSVTHVLCALCNVELVACSKICMKLKDKNSDM